MVPWERVPSLSLLYIFSSKYVIFSVGFIYIAHCQYWWVEYKYNGFASQQKFGNVKEK